MPLYAYKGIASSGKSTNGVRDAESPKVLRQTLRKDGIFVTEVSLSKKHSKNKGGLNRDIDLGELFGGVKKGEIAGFTRQLATLVRSGIPLAESIGALFEQAENIRFKSAIEEIRSMVNEGFSLADALAKHPKMFDGLYVAMVRAGEAAGNLDEVLSRLADFMESAQRLKGKVQSAMIYPVIMVVVGSAIMMVLMIAVVPKITQIFVSKDKALPLNTEILIATSKFIGNHWLLLLIAVALAIWGFRKWARSKSGQPAWHGFILKMPLLAPLIKQIAVARFSRTLGTMLKAGVPMLRSLEISKAILGNVILMATIDTAKTAVTEGESLALSLRKSGHFPPTVTHMIAVGERTGQLEEMLLRVSDAYDQDVDAKLTTFTATLEPLMIVVMGGAIFFVVLSVLMPLMDMQSFAGS